jgi:hypothetical protein
MYKVEISHYDRVARFLRAAIDMRSKPIGVGQARGIVVGRRDDRLE